jgi:hypothetical protein
LNDNLYIEIVNEIFDGYTRFDFKDQTVFLRHFSLKDQEFLNKNFEQHKNRAIAKGIQEEKDVLARLDKDGTWSKDDENKILELESFVQNLEKTKSKLMLPSQKEGHQKLIDEEKFKLFELNLDSFRQVLKASPDRFSGAKGVLISLPNAEGNLERYEMFESSNFEPALQAQFPEIRSYVGIGVDDKSSQIRLSAAPNGIQAMFFRADRRDEFMEPYAADGSVYAVGKYLIRKPGEKEIIKYVKTLPLEGFNVILCMIFLIIDAHLSFIHTLGV